MVRQRARSLAPAAQQHSTAQHVAWCALRARLSSGKHVAVVALAEERGRGVSCQRTDTLSSRRR